jgi:hypothetical protein
MVKETRRLYNRCKPCPVGIHHRPPSATQWRTQIQHFSPLSRNSSPDCPALQPRAHQRTSLRAARCPMTRPCWSRRGLFVAGRDQRPAVRTRERPGASRRRKSPAIGADDEPGAWRYRLRLLRRSVTFLQPLRPATRINLSRPCGSHRRISLGPAKAGPFSYVTLEGGFCFNKPTGR